MVLGLGVRLAELVRRGQADAAGPGEGKPLGQKPGLVDQEGRDDDVVEEVEHVVQQGAVEVRRHLLDAAPPRQHAVERVDGERHGHPHEGRSPLLSRDGDERQQTPQRTAGGEGVGGPGNGDS